MASAIEREIHRLDPEQVVTEVRPMLDLVDRAIAGARFNTALLTIFAGALLGSLIFVPLSLKKKRLVPFGVFLAVGAVVAFVFGDAIIAWYGHFLKGD